MMNETIKKPTLRMVAVNDLIPYARNARTHSDQQIAQIAASIREFGFRNPVLIDGDNGIIAGHGRVEAARKLDMTKVPCIDCSDMSETARRAYTLADNRIALSASWDAEMLGLELVDLSALGMELELLGFDETELNALLTDKAEQEGEDDTPELDEDNVVSKPGDVWLLGKHRLMCGDSTRADDVAVLLAGELVDCTFTSPPYAVGVDYKGYDDSIDNLRKILSVAPGIWRSVTVPGGFAVVNFGDVVPGKDIVGEMSEYPMAIEYWPAFRKEKWALWSRRIWKKPHARVHSPWVIQSNRAAADWEHIWVWIAPGKAICSRSDTSAFGIWDSTTGDGVDLGKDIHPAAMPVSIARSGIINHSRSGHIVFEPFIGTGTTMIAAQTADRRCFGLEQAPPYVDMAVRRWMEFTGETATLEATGEPFPAPVPTGAAA